MAGNRASKWQQIVLMKWSEIDPSNKAFKLNTSFVQRGCVMGSKGLVSFTEVAEHPTLTVHIRFSVVVVTFYFLMKYD